MVENDAAPATSSGFRVCCPGGNLIRYTMLTLNVSQEEAIEIIALDEQAALKEQWQ
jgi:hypothetical protein